MSKQKLINKLAENRKIGIKVENLTKKFEFSRNNRFTLKERFVNVFRNSEKEFFTALEDITFDIHAGDFVGFIGRNGSGKSTLLKIIAGIYAPTSGKVEVQGKIVPFLELGVGFNPELTGEENVYLNGTILGMSTREIDAKLDEIFAFAEINDFRKMQLKHYSSGMMVRLAFAIAMQVDGDIFIMDEVLAVGDANFQTKCLAKLHEIIENKKTILYVSHSIETVKQYCNKVVYIKDHKMAAFGDAENVTHMYQEDLARA